MAWVQSLHHNDAVRVATLLTHPLRIWLPPEGCERPSNSIDDGVGIPLSDGPPSLTAASGVGGVGPIV
ncbi:MAG: hypothetical protein ACP5HZ_11500, partial [Ferrimicrobium sp.]